MKKLLMLSVILLCGCMEETYTLVVIPENDPNTRTVHTHHSQERGALYVDDIIR